MLPNNLLTEVCSGIQNFAVKNLGGIQIVLVYC